MLIKKSRVKVTAAGVGQSQVFVLGSPVDGFVSFPGGETTYTVLSPSGKWQIGAGSVQGINLTRGTVEENYLGNTSQIDFTGETVQIAQTISASFMDTISNKLSTIAIGAKGDMLGSAIKAAYEGEADTNNYSDYEKTKLARVIAGAPLATVVVFNPSASLPVDNTQEAIDRTREAVDNHTQAASTIDYDSTDDPSGVGTDVQEAMLEHGKAIKVSVPTISGVTLGGVISADIGTNIFTVGSGTGEVVNNYSDLTKSTVIYLDWAAQIEVSINPEVGTDIFVAMGIFMASTPDTAILVKHIFPIPFNINRDHILLGILYIENGIIIDVVNTPSIPRQTSTDVYDIFRQSSKLIGGEVMANPTTLTLWQKSGHIFYPGINWYTDVQNPNILEFVEVGVAPNPPMLFDTLLRTGAIGIEDISDVPKSYDLDGVLTALPVGKSVIHRVYQFGSTDGNKTLVIQYGQMAYDTLVEAEQYMFTDGFEEATTTNGLWFLAYIGISEAATSFDDNSLAWIRQAQDHSGAMTGSSGVALLATNHIKDAAVRFNTINTNGELIAEIALTSSYFRTSGPLASKALKPYQGSILHVGPDGLIIPIYPEVADENWIDRNTQDILLSADVATNIGVLLSLNKSITKGYVYCKLVINTDIDFISIRAMILINGDIKYISKNHIVEKGMRQTVVEAFPFEVPLQINETITVEVIASHNCEIKKSKLQITKVTT